MDMSALLPVWIIGMPLLVALVERFRTPSGGRVGHAQVATPGARTALPGAR